MGLLSRTKGKVFERKVAKGLRDAFPGLDAHRSSQAERARNPDLILDRPPHPLLARLWLELEDAKEPDPYGKYAQAVGDLGRLGEAGRDRLPVVVWHKYRSTVVWATTTISVLDDLRGVRDAVFQVGGGLRTKAAMVTTPLDDFIAILQEQVARRTE
jgi:hypothetical protein